MIFHVCWAAGKMLTLALESSTTRASVALFEGAKLIGELQSDIQRSHSEFMNSAILTLLNSRGMDPAKISLIATTPGPGSFTGVRVASSLAKTMAYSLNVPIWSIDSLSALASCSNLAPNPQKFVAINAFKNMVYYSAFSGENKLVGPSVIEINRVGEIMDNLFVMGQIQFYGDAYELCRAVLRENLRDRLLSPSHSTMIFPSASQIGTLSNRSPDLGTTLDWNLFQPLYLRASEAEENLRLRGVEKLK